MRFQYITKIISSETKIFCKTQRAKRPKSEIAVAICEEKCYNFRVLELIVNPVARRGEGIKEVEKAKSFFDEKGVAYREHVTQRRKHAAELACKLAVGGADTVVACGGDGTIHEIVNGLMSARRLLEEKGEALVTRLALLPCGTGNDFIRSAGISLDAYEAATVIARGESRGVDLICIDGIYEICFACRGLDVDVVQQVNSSARKTEASYTKKALNCIFKRLNYDFSIIADGVVQDVNGVIAAVLNGWSIASGLNFCPTAKIDDGLMDLIIIKSQSRMKTLKSFMSIVKGNVESDGAVCHLRCRHVEISAKQKYVDIDGELYDGVRFVADIVPSALNLIR